MNKEMLEDEIEFPDDIISFMKVKYPKAHTDQEKAVLKQIEQLAEEKKELKDIISKKKEEAKFKSLPFNAIPSEEAKEKAIKLVQDGTLQLSSKAKTIDLDDSPLETHHANSTSQKQKIRLNDDNKKLDSTNIPKVSTGSSKISFVSGGYAFAEGQSKSVEETHDSNLKRSLSTTSSASDMVSKKFRHLSSRESSDSEDQEKSNMDKNPENRASNSSSLRFCGHNMREDFVRRIVEPYGNVVALELEERHDNSVNVVVTLDNPEIARTAKEALDSQFIEGRIVNVYFKRGGSEFSQRRPFRRRRNRDFGRARGRFHFQRNESFPSIENDNILPSHFYATGTDIDDNVNRKIRWSVPEDSESNETISKAVNLSSTPKTSSERMVVNYDDLDPL